jgi:moderate conductance mechanosensitive channel
MIHSGPLLSTLTPTPDEAASATERISRPLLVLLVIVGTIVVNRIIRAAIRMVVRYVAKRSIAHPSRWWRTRARYHDLEEGEIGENRRRQRVDAVARMMYHIVAVVLWIGVLIAVFHILDIDAAFFLSSAGFIGAGAAIGGQHKVNDYLTGLSVLIEDRYGVGDEIEISGSFPAGVRGVVEHIGLVSTRVRDGFSTVHLPHSALVAVRNLSQEPVETKLAIQLPVDAERSDAASRAAATIRELAGSENLTGVVLVNDVAAETPIEGVDQVEVKVLTSRPLSATERETLVRRTEERLSSTES